MHDPTSHDLDEYTERYLSGQDGDTLEVAMVWGDHVLSVNQHPGARVVTVGRAADSDYVVEADEVPEGPFPLVVAQDGAYYLCVTAAMRGVVQQSGHRWTLAELAAAGGVAPSSALPGASLVPLPPRSSARLDFGEVTLLIAFAERAEAIGGMGGVDTQPLGYILSSAFVHMAFLALALTIPADVDAFELDSAAASDRFARLALAPEQVEPPEPLPSDLSTPSDSGAATSGRRGPEGAAGRKDAPPEAAGRRAVAGESDREKLSRDTRIAQDAGAVGALNTMRETMGGDLFASADQSLGRDTQNALGGIEGDGPGDARGEEGLGIKGTGRGGPGDGEEGVGIGDSVTCPPGEKCDDRRRGPGKKPGPGIGERDASTPDPEVFAGPIESNDCMSREAIKRVFRQKRNELRYCYERELQRRPDLEGQVSVRVSINSNGDVFSSTVKKSSMGSPRVEQCVAQKIKRWTFSPPKNGCHVVNINYPINFTK
jgi:TonB family protein